MIFRLRVSIAKRALCTRLVTAWTSSMLLVCALQPSYTDTPAKRTINAPADVLATKLDLCFSAPTGTLGWSSHDRLALCVNVGESAQQIAATTLLTPAPYLPKPTCGVGNIGLTLYAARNCVSPGTIRSAGGQLVVEGSTLLALQGSLNVRGGDFNSPADVTIAGETCISQRLIPYTGTGATNDGAGLVNERVHSDTDVAHINANTPDLVLPVQCVSSGAYLLL